MLALALAPVWCAIPGVSPMHGAAIAAASGSQDGCAGHACDEASTIAAACACPAAADVVSVPRPKAPDTTPLTPEAAVAPTVSEIPPVADINRLSGVSPGHSSPRISSTLVTLRVLLLI